jgi:hypothetical protein
LLINHCGDSEVNGRRAKANRLGITCPTARSCDAQVVLYPYVARYKPPRDFGTLHIDEIIEGRLVRAEYNNFRH